MDTGSFIREGGRLNRERNQFFPTPIAVCQRMIELAELNSESVILEPSAGSR